MGEPMSEQPWHCAQIPNGDNPVVVCQRADLLAEVDRLTADNARLRVISEAAQRWGQAIVVAEAAPVGANSFERIAAHEAADALLVALGIPPHPADRANQAGEEAP